MVEFIRELGMNVNFLCLIAKQLKIAWYEFTVPFIFPKNAQFLTEPLSIFHDPKWVEINQAEQF